MYSACASVINSLCKPQERSVSCENHLRLKLRSAMIGTRQTRVPSTQLTVIFSWFRRLLSLTSKIYNNRSNRLNYVVLILILQRSEVCKYVHWSRLEVGQNRYWQSILFLIQRNSIIVNMTSREPKIWTYLLTFFLFNKTVTLNMNKTSHVAKYILYTS